MSFYTNLIFYRPRKPPIVTGGDLAEFISGIKNVGVLDDSSDLNLQIKYGQAIDQDDLAADWDEPTESPYICTFGEIDWDDQQSSDSVEKLIATLSGDQRAIYRCYVGLGGATEEIIDHLKRVNSPENDTDLWLTGCSFELGPIELSSLESTEIVQAGWIGVSLHGYGYLWPWSLRDLVNRAEAHPGLQALTALCRATWPVPRRKPDRATRDLRAKHADVWPYEDTSLEWDWYWGVAESG
jgi:hypothetical protein